jgi:hypothetical protein
MARRKTAPQSLTTRSIKRTAKELRKFEPLIQFDALLGHACVGCGADFKIGDVTTLVPVGPGSFQESRARAREGRPYNAVAVPLHWACATGEETEEKHE